MFLRRSTPEAWAEVLAAINGQGDAALGNLPTTGYVWPDGSGIGYAVKYAHRDVLSEGDEPITLVTGRPVGALSREKLHGHRVPAQP